MIAEAISVLRHRYRPVRAPGYQLSRAKRDWNVVGAVTIDADDEGAELGSEALEPTRADQIEPIIAARDNLGMMHSCPACQGFVPASIDQCPHCDRHLGQPKRPSLATRLGTSLLVSSTAMTLMACYGAPGGYCGDYMDYDECYGWSETGTTGGHESWTGDGDGDGDGDTGQPETETETDSETDTDTDSDSDSDSGGMEACDTASVALPIEDGELPLTVEDALEYGVGTSEGSCGGAGAEAIYEWVPPASGLYDISVEADADFVVYARVPDPHLGGSCGYELGCATRQGSADPRLRVELHEGRAVQIFVDGATADEVGKYALTIDAI